MKHFERFLKRHGIYNEFIQTFSELNTNFDAKEYIEFNNNSYNAMFEAFVWSDTKRGGLFWSKINDKWENTWYNIQNYED